MKARKITSLVLALLMVFSMVSMGVAAEETGVTASTEAELREKISGGATYITLADDIALNSKLSITASNITIDGAGHTITASDSFAADITGQINLVKLIGADELSGVTGVTLKNITLQTTSLAQHALDVYKSTGIVLENVTLDHTNAAKGAALVCNASQITIQGTFDVKVGENSWYGINVADVNGDACVTFAEDADISFSTLGQTFMQADVSQNNHNELDMYAGRDFYITCAGENASGTRIYYYDLDGFSSAAVATVYSEYTDEEEGVTYTFNYAYTTLEQAVADAGDGDTITLLKDVTLTETLTVDVPVTINGNDKTVKSSAYKVFEVNFGDIDTEKFEVTFENITIENTSGTKESRCIDTRNDNTTLNIENSTLIGSGSNCQVVNIGGKETATPNTVNITNSSITASDSGYGVVCWVPSEINITGTDITGYTTVYVKGGTNNDATGTTVNVKDGTVLTSSLESTDEGNTFGTIAIEDITDVVVNVDAGAEINTSGAVQYAFSAKMFVTDSTSANCVFNVKGDTNLTNGAKMFMDQKNMGTGETTGNALYISGGTHNTDPSAYLASAKYEAVEKDNMYVVGEHKVEEGLSYGASCTMDGRAEHYICNICGQKYKDAEGKVTVTDAELVIPKGHKKVEVEGKAPTCTETGYDAYIKCTECPNMWDKDGKGISAETGVPVLPATGHTPATVRVGIVDATHEAAGYTGDVVCAHCEEVRIKGEVVAKLEAEVVAPPSISEEAHEEVAAEIESVVEQIAESGEISEETKTVLSEGTEEAIVEAQGNGDVIGADIVTEPIVEEDLSEAELVEFKKAAEAIEEKAATLAKEGEEVVVAQYIDISVLVVNRSDGNKFLGNITELETPVTIDILVPKELRGEGKTPVVVHYHDGKAEIITGKYNAETGVLSIEASKFSTYALAVVTKTSTTVEPTEKPSATTEPTATPAPTTAPTATPAPTQAPTSTVPATGDESNVFAAAAVMMLCAAAAVVLYKKSIKA